MEAIEFLGRWREPEGTPQGQANWIAPGKLGLQTYTATVKEKPVSTIRRNANTKQCIVRITGWVWNKPFAGSPAEKMGVGETETKAFPDLRMAKQAVKYALDHHPSNLTTS